MSISLAPFAAPDIAPVPPTLRAFSARRIGYVLLVLLALLSKDALAQGTREIVVTLEPGEHSRSITVAPNRTYVLELRSPGHICNWPSLDTLRSQIPQMTAEDLNSLESFGTETSGSITRAINVLLAIGASPSTRYAVNFQNGSRTTDTVFSPGATILFERDCLDLGEARSGLLQIRQVIRARLGLPLIPTKPARVEQLERPATLQAPTGAGSPATIR